MMVAWTTTPWTLPSNLALCVNPEFEYVRVRDPEKNRVLVVAESRLEFIPGAVPKKGKKDKKGDGNEEKKGFQVSPRVRFRVRVCLLGVSFPILRRAGRQNRDWGWSMGAF